MIRLASFPMESPTALPRHDLSGCRALPGSSLTRSIKQPSRRILGGDVRRLERVDQAIDRGEIDLDLPALVALGRDAVDPPGRLVAEGVAADAGVVPVGHEHRAIGRGAGIDGPEPRVVAAKEDLVFGPERGPLASHREEVDLAGAGVDLEDRALVFAPASSSPS